MSNIFETVSPALLNYVKYPLFAVAAVCVGLVVITFVMAVKQTKHK